MGPVQSHKDTAVGGKLVSDAGLTVDGILGPKTLAAVNSVDPAKLLQVLRYKAAEYYYSLAGARKDSRVFLFGWLNRAYF